MFTKIKENVKDALLILKLNTSKMFEVADRPFATMFGIAVFVLPPVLNLILSSIQFPSFGVIFFKFLFWPMFIPVLAIAGSIFLMSVIARKAFNGHGNDIGFFRVMSYSAVVLVCSVVPFLFAWLDVDIFGFFNLIWIAALVWMFIVVYKFLPLYHKLNQQDTVVVLIVGAIGYVLLRGILGNILVGGAYRWFLW